MIAQEALASWVCRLIPVLVRSQAERAVAVAAILCAILVLHLDNLQKFSACVAGGIANGRRDAAGNNVAHHGRHQVRKVRTSLDTAFRDSQAAGLFGFSKSRRVFRNNTLLLLSH